MNYWLFLIPVLSAFLGWLVNWTTIKLLFHPRKPKKIFGLVVQGIFPARQAQWAIQAGQWTAASFPFDRIHEKINDPASLEKIMPTIENHVDDFLRIRLVKEMPYLGMLVGDKTIASMKKIFMQEIETLFPQIMTELAGNLENELNPGKIVREKMAGLSLVELETLFYKKMSRELRSFRLFGALLGLLVGIVEFVIIWITN